LFPSRWLPARVIRGAHHVDSREREPGPNPGGEAVPGNQRRIPGPAHPGRMGGNLAPVLATDPFLADSPSLESPRLVGRSPRRGRPRRLRHRPRLRPHPSASLAPPSSINASWPASGPAIARNGPTAAISAPRAPSRIGPPRPLPPPPPGTRRKSPGSWASSARVTAG